MRAEVKPIRTKRDHEAALKEVERLWGTKAGTPDGARAARYLGGCADTSEPKTRGVTGAPICWGSARGPGPQIAQSTAFRSNRVLQHRATAATRTPVPNYA